MERRWEAGAGGGWRGAPWADRGRRVRSTRGFGAGIAATPPQTVQALTVVELLGEVHLGRGHGDQSGQACENELHDCDCTTGAGKRVLRLQACRPRASLCLRLCQRLLCVGGREHPATLRRARPQPAAGSQGRFLAPSAPKAGATRGHRPVLETQCGARLPMQLAPAPARASALRRKSRVQCASCMCARAYQHGYAARTVASGSAARFGIAARRGADLKTGRSRHRPRSYNSARATPLKAGSRPCRPSRTASTGPLLPR